MELTLYQIDAFANKPFEGNPAAICPLDTWLPDDMLQAIALENNLSETAYFVPQGEQYHLRWFTPSHEVDLCGHATLASAHVLFTMLGHKLPQIEFATRSGILTVSKQGDWLDMNFPVQPPAPCVTPMPIIEAFATPPIACLKAEDYIVVFEHESEVIDAAPKLFNLAELDLRGVAITAKARDHDFVVRFFAPNYGINEDPVTGSAYTQLAPYWSAELNKNTLIARQVSKRGGVVKCEMAGKRVKIAGKAALYLTGTINI